MFSRVQKLAQTRQKNDEKQKFLRRQKLTETIENTGFIYWTSKHGAPLPGL
jgi:CMP-N-acetylneuraminic acid synthetase